MIENMMVKEEQQDILKKKWESPQLTLLEYINIETSSVSFAVTDGVGNYS